MDRGIGGGGREGAGRKGWRSKERELMLCSIISRKLRADDHDAGLVPTGPIARGHGLQPRRHGPEHISRHLRCCAEHRDGVYGVQIARLDDDWWVFFPFVHVLP